MPSASSGAARPGANPQTSDAMNAVAAISLPGEIAGTMAVIPLSYLNELSIVADKRSRGRSRAAVERLPYPQRRCRHVDRAHPGLGVERIDDRIDQRRRRTDGAGFARALDAERVRGARHVAGREAERRQIVGARHGVVHERAAEDLAAVLVIDGVLEHRLPESLHDPAMHL